MSINFSTLLPPVDSIKQKSGHSFTHKVQQLGPRATSTMWTSDIKEATVLRMGGPGSLADITPSTIHTILQEAAEKAPQHVAMKYKFSHEDKYFDMTFSDYYRLSCMAAKSFIELGLEPRHAVCIAGFNSPPWVLSFIGTILAGGVGSGVYTTNNSETLLFILNNCSCQIAVVESKELLLRYLEVSTQAPKLKAIIQFRGKIKPILKSKWGLGLYEFEEFMKLGEKVDDKFLVERIEKLVPNECCSLIYTSGTTGNPKGVMMSHDNLTWTAKCAALHMKFRSCKEEFISYLPLSHVAAQMCDIIIPIICQATVWFAQPDALKGSLGRTLKEVRPTYFIGVPRVWEKIEEQMKEVGISLSSTKKSISAWAKEIGLRTNLAMMDKEPTPYGYFLAKFLIFNKVRANLGFDRCLGFFSAAAPISREILHYFASLNIIICEIYGMSECSGPHSVGIVHEFYFGTVGKIFPEFKNKIDCKEGENEGEVCMFGRHIFMGYVGSQEKTSEMFDTDNWLHSGDIGVIDNDGYLRITGRIKELIITAGGENIAPVPIEEKIKEGAEIISNAMVIGDKKKFLSVLLTIKCEMNLETQFATNILSPSVIRWCKLIDYNVEHVSEIIADKHPHIWATIDKALHEANKKAVSKAAHVQRWIFLPCDFSIGGGELGPTMKVKRGVVTNMYSALIDQIYES